MNRPLSSQNKKQIANCSENLRMCSKICMMPNHIGIVDHIFEADTAEKIRLLPSDNSAVLMGYHYHFIIGCDLHSHGEQKVYVSLQWRHNGHDGVSNYLPHDCLLNHLFRRRSKKTSKLRVTGLCEGNSPVNSPHKGPVTRKMFPFDDVMMSSLAH